MSRNRRRNKNHGHAERRFADMASSNVEKPETPKVQKEPDNQLGKPEWTQPAVVSQAATAFVTVVLAVLVIVQIGDARRTFQTSERSWVLIKEVRWATIEERARRIGATLVIENLGKSPARTVRIEPHIVVVGNRLGLPYPAHPFVTGVFKGDSNVNLFVPSFTGVVGPSAYTERAVELIVGVDDLIQLASGEKGLRLAGAIQYTDIFNLVHMTHFCYLATVDDITRPPRSLGICSDGNDAG
jgi:hypothetical protein